MPDSLPLVSIQIVVHNGARFLRHCFEAVRRQTYGNVEVVVLDNASTDGTREIIELHFPEFRYIRHDRNLGMWPGQEFLLRHTRGDYVLTLSVDVVLDPTFVERATAAFCSDSSIAAIQGKMYQYEIAKLEAEGTTALCRDVIDSCGFGMMRSRKVLNVGHGQPDGPEFSRQRTIFGVEGAAPMFRRTALERCRIDGSLIDTDYFWYGDDLDLAWRMTLFGLRQEFVPGVVAWHDRSTTKGAAGSLSGHLSRIAVRRAIPLRKRRLDWSNVRFTIIKNDYIMNVLRDAPWILAREVATCIYTLIFEPRVFAESGRFFRLLPRMVRRRALVMQRAVVSPAEMHAWFT